MSKLKITYVCQACGAQFAKWQGRCHACNTWNSVVEEIINPANTGSSSSHVTLQTTPTLLQEISADREERIVCEDPELNRVLGGGIVPGSLILLGGEPGIGKSTLLLQLALSFPNHKVLYVSGEESLQQIKLRAQRLHKQAENCYLLHETALEQVLAAAAKLSPHFLIIDSIQTLYTSQLESSMGSVAQVRACAAALMQYAKRERVPVFLIGHITKEGNLAGPKVLEHMVDTVLQFEGDSHLMHRILRSMKNRFGATSELGIYTMQQQGLLPVNDPSSFLRSPHASPMSGIALGVLLEGNRALLLEVQALVSNANYGTPQRTTTGFDIKRLNMLLAVLEKRAGFKLSSRDVFLNIAGGLAVKDPGLDMAVCMAITSSFLDSACPPESCFIGEVGLSGEMRGVIRLSQRLQEAIKLGIKKLYIPSIQHNKEEINQTQYKYCQGSSQLSELIRTVF